MLFSIGNSERGEFTERLVKIVRLKLSSNTENRQNFEKTCLAARRHKSLDFDRMTSAWKQTMERLVAVLGARTLLLQFLALSIETPILAFEPAKLLDFFAYVSILKRLDFGAKILFKELEQHEQIPLRSFSLNGRCRLFTPNFDPFISFGLQQEHLVEFNGEVDPSGK